MAEAGADAWVRLWSLLAHCELRFPQGDPHSLLTSLWGAVVESSVGCGQITARMYAGLHPGWYCLRHVLVLTKWILAE